MYAKQCVVALDMEGVLTPEIWINVAEKTGVEGLRLTTRDVPDYNELMQGRLKLLQENNLTLSDIRAVIAKLKPLDGAVEFLNELRRNTQVIILSDTFLEFAKPLIAQLDYPTLFCHNLIVENDIIVDYQLRQQDQKRKVVAALKTLNFNILAGGDSYNDTAMLCEADCGILFRAPERVKSEFPQFETVETHPDFLAAIMQWLAGN